MRRDFTERMDPVTVEMIFGRSINKPRRIDLVKMQGKMDHGIHIIAFHVCRDQYAGFIHDSFLLRQAV